MGETGFQGFTSPLQALADGGFACLVLLCRISSRKILVVVSHHRAEESFRELVETVLELIKEFGGGHFLESLLQA